MIRKIKENYHWLIALLVFLEMLIYGGLLNSFSVFIQPVSSGLGVSTTAYSFADMPRNIMSFLSTCVTGAVFLRFGYKKAAIASLLLGSLSMLIAAMTDSIVMFAFSRGLFGLSYGVCFTAGIAYIIKRWFWKRQGFVMGAVSMSSGVGGSLMTMLLTKVILSSGWRSAYLVAAICAAGLAVLFLLIKDQPEQMGLQPYGYGEPEESKKVRRGRADFPGYPMKEQLKRPMFYLMCMCVLVSCVCLTSFSGFVVPHFISQGYTAEQASVFQSFYMLVLSAVKVLLGILYDKFGAKPVMVLCMLGAAAGEGILAYTNDFGLCLIAMVLFSAGLCMTSMMIPLISTELFGYEACLNVNGVFVGLVGLSHLFASPISSMCYDATGVYTPVYRVTSVVLLGVLAVYLWLFSMAKKEQQPLKNATP